LVTPPYAAEIVRVVWEPTFAVVMLNGAEAAPAATVTLAGTVAEGSELVNDTTAPPAGAEPFRDTVPLAFTPAATDTGLIASETRIAGVTLSDANFEFPFNSAPIVADAAAGTAAVVIVNEAEVAPAGTMMLAGTLADGSELDRLTVVPPAGAAAVRVTLLLAIDAPPMTVAAPRLTALTSKPKCNETVVVASVETASAGMVTLLNPGAEADSV
jgi:hypothetical protein